jgi:hypothetical protein
MQWLTWFLRFLPQRDKVLMSEIEDHGAGNIMAFLFVQALMITRLPPQYNEKSSFRPNLDLSSVEKDLWRQKNWVNAMSLSVMFFHCKIRVCLDRVSIRHAAIVQQEHRTVSGPS